MLLPLLSSLAAAIAAEASWEPCVLPPTRHLNFSEPCAAHSDVATPSISWAAQRGEFESAQLLLSATGSSGGGGGQLSVHFSDLVSPLGDVISSTQLTWRQQGYVLVRHTSRYADSGCPGLNKDGSCWRPDPLLEPAENNTIAMPTDPAWSQPLWVTIEVPRNATPAKQHSEYSGKLTLSLDGAQFANVNISLEVWQVAVRTPAEASVQHVWGFASEHVLPFYPNLPPAQVQMQWWEFMQAHRLPPMDTAAWKPAASSTPFLAGKTAAFESGLESHDCNCSACPPNVAKRNAQQMKPTVEAARQVTNAKFFAYGFDERPRSCEKSIRTAFGAFMDEYPYAQYPWIGGTMGALNWAGSGGDHGPTGSHPSDGGMPLDMPYTAWVLQYQYYNQTTADVWVNSSYKGRPRELYLYHCIEPSGVKDLNIFIERPLIQARLLFWLGAVQNIQGWLYWTTSLWANCPTSPHAWQRTNRTVMRRINGTSMLTDFDPASIIWCSQKLFDFWVNGDGYYMYPGPNGPISTSRLEEIRDALEDMELLRMVPSAVRDAAVAQLVTGPTQHKDDPLLLEQVRRSIGRQAHLF